MHFAKYPRCYCEFFVCIYVCVISICIENILNETTFETKIQY